MRNVISLFGWENKKNRRKTIVKDLSTLHDARAALESGNIEAFLSLSSELDKIKDGNDRLRNSLNKARESATKVDSSDKNVVDKFLTTKNVVDKMIATVFCAPFLGVLSVLLVAICIWNVVKPPIPHEFIAFNDLVSSFSLDTHDIPIATPNNDMVLHSVDYEVKRNVSAQSTYVKNEINEVSSFKSFSVENSQPSSHILLSDGSDLKIPKPMQLVYMDLVTPAGCSRSQQLEENWKRIVMDKIKSGECKGNCLDSIPIKSRKKSIIQCTLTAGPIPHEYVEPFEKLVKKVETYDKNMANGAYTFIVPHLLE
ncbi:MAG: hypothetical protein MI864_24970 [Pseudomonadales bacterium]|nr:hypothetical protein [Pseudomonadales bacterium]